MNTIEDLIREQAEKETAREANRALVREAYDPDRDPLAALGGYLTTSNEQIASIEKIMVEAFNALIKEAEATRDMLADTLKHNRNINSAAVEAVRDAGLALNTLSQTHQDLAKKFRDVASNGK